MILRFNLPIDHLHKLISPLSIEFIRMELRLHYVFVLMYCDFFASGLLFTEIIACVGGVWGGIGGRFGRRLEGEGRGNSLPSPLLAFPLPSPPNSGYAGY